MVDAGKLKKHGNVFFFTDKTFVEGVAAKIEVSVIASPPPKSCSWTVNGYYLDGVNYKNSESHLVRCAQIFNFKNCNSIKISLLSTNKNGNRVVQETLVFP